MGGRGEGGCARVVVSYLILLCLCFLLSAVFVGASFFNHGTWFLGDGGKGDCGYGVPLLHPVCIFVLFVCVFFPLGYHISLLVLVIHGGFSYNARVTVARLDNGIVTGVPSPSRR